MYYFNQIVVFLAPKKLYTYTYLFVIYYVRCGGFDHFLIQYAMYVKMKKTKNVPKMSISHIIQ